MSIHAKSEKLKYFPQALDFDDFDYPRKPVDDIIKIGIISDCSRPRKNIANQLIAAKLISHELENVEVHTKNLQQHHGRFAQRIGLDLYNSKMNDSHDSFLDWMSTFHLGLEVSYTEAFNYQAAEYMLMGIPVVVGPTVDWAHSVNIVPSPDSPVQIASRGVYLSRKSNHNASQEYAERALRTNNFLVNKAVDEVLSGK